MAFDHAGFQVSDIDKSIQFYTEKLGFRLLFKTEAKDYGEIGAFLEWNGAKLELLQSINMEFHPKKPEKPFCPHICFEADDMDEVVKMLKENDIPILDGPNEVPGSDRWIYFTDPDQNVLEYIVWLNKDRKGLR